MNRRQFLVRTGSTLTGAVTGSIAVTGTASASAYSSQPDEVTLKYDEARLKQYRPLLITEALDPDLQTPVLNSWVATHETRDTFVCCYWSWYPEQRGYSSADSHRPDREPVYVFVDELTGEVTKVVYDGWHYIAATDLDPRIHDAFHVQLYVIYPWHPYRRPKSERNKSAGQYLKLRNMHDAYEVWLGEGWDVNPPTVVDPWSINSRGHWWSDALDATVRRRLAFTELFITRVTPINLRAGEESDLA